MTERFRPRPGVTARQVGDAVFLVDPDSDTLYHLNATGAALWRLLEDPAAAAEAAAILKEAFPDVPAGRVDAEVKDLFADLAARDLIRPAG